MRSGPPNPVRIFVTVGEAFAVLFAGVAAAASVWQGYVIHRALPYPLFANFQAVEIKQCADWIYAARYFLDKVQWVTVGVYSQEKSRAASEKEFKQVQEDEAKERWEASAKLHSETARLRIYASDSTDAELSDIEKLQTAMITDRHPADSEKFAVAIERIAKKCRSVMAGETVGAL